MKIIVLISIILCLANYPLFAQYSSDWTSSNLGQYGWGGSFGYDIDTDGLVEFEVRTEGEFRFYNGDYTAEWTIPFLGYTYVNITHPRDIDGDGILVPLNTDGDGAGELIVTGFYISGSTYYGRFRVYDAASHSLEYESPLITGFYGSATQEDINGDGRDEIIIVRYGSSTTTSYVDVYTYTGFINENNAAYQISSSLTALPNPASMEIAVTFSIAKEESGYPVTVIIYDGLGREIKNLWCTSEVVRGDYRLIWDGLDNNGLAVPTGNYFIQIKKQNKIETQHIQMIR